MAVVVVISERCCRSRKLVGGPSRHRWTAKVDHNRNGGWEAARPRNRKKINATEKKQNKTEQRSSKRKKEDQYAVRRRHARVFSLWRVMDSLWRSIMAQERSVSSSPVAKAEILASSDQRAIGPVLLNRLKILS